MESIHIESSVGEHSPPPPHAITTLETLQAQEISATSKFSENIDVLREKHTGPDAHVFPCFSFWSLSEYYTPLVQTPIRMALVVDRIYNPFLGATSTDASTRRSS